MKKPLLLIDVDGVLNPSMRPRSPMPEGYASHDVGGQRVLLSQRHGEWLRELADHFELAWVTTWEAEADALIAPIIDAPAGLPFMSFPDLTDDGWTWKLPAVRRFVEDRAAAWLDDNPGPDAGEWAKSRVAPTLLVMPDPEVGWTRAECDELIVFAKSCVEARS
ncbi:MAG: HAD domain-containing protein [Chloroflexota bacterium]|nr:HAD domain-containing protein [Chloroflexota bacterium]